MEPPERRPGSEPDPEPSQPRSPVTLPPPPGVPTNTGALPPPPGEVSHGPQAGTLPPPRVAGTEVKRRRLWIPAGVLVIIALAIAAGLAAGPGLSMPDTLAGHPRLQDENTDALEASLESEVGDDALVGVYGSTLQPVFIVVALGETPPAGQDPLEEFGAGFVQGAQGASGSLDLDAKVTRTIASVVYRCVPISISYDVGGTLDSTLCDWDDGATYGLVISFDPLLDLLDLAPTIHDAVVD
jgi:hypothetical protein